MQISGMALPQILNGPCGISIEKRNNILNNLRQVISQNRKYSFAKILQFIIKLFVFKMFLERKHLKICKLMLYIIRIYMN